MKKEFKYPCAVEAYAITDGQGDELQDAFIKLGASLYDEYRARRYYGVDIDGDTQYYLTLRSFAGGDEEVILYTYEEIMSFVAKLEQPEEASGTKRQLKFPCAIAMSEITSQEVYDKVFDAFIEAGAVVHEDYKDDYRQCDYKYCGVDYDKDTMHWHDLQDYKQDFSPDSVTLYSLEDILGTTNQQNRVTNSPYDFSLIGKEVLYIPSSKRYLIEGVDIGDETITIGSDKDSGEIVCKLTDVVFIDQQEAPSEPLGGVLEPSPSVGIDEVVGLTTGASVKIEFTICVGGVAHKGSRDEAFKIYQDLQSIFEKEVV